MSVSRLPRPLLMLVAALAISIATFGAPGTSAADDCVNPAGGVTAFPPGTPVRQCTVPAGVTRITVEAWGAQGGDNGHYDAKTDKGGAGGHAIRTNLPVTPGAILYIVGGQAGGNAGSTTTGAGGGGGSSGVYTRYPPRNLSEVVVIAGGGGGAGCDDGGWGGGAYADSYGAGSDGFIKHICPGSAFASGGGKGGIGGRSSPEGSNSGNGWGGSGRESFEGGYGGWGGSELGGHGGYGYKQAMGRGYGGGGGGGYGGGGGGGDGGGGGGGSYPGLDIVSPSWGNGRVQMSNGTTASAVTANIRKGPPGLTRRRRATITFSSAEPSRFVCSLTGRRVKPKLRPWRRCGARGVSRRGKVTYRGLRPGVKVFRVKLLAGDGATSNPQRREWRVVR